MNVTAALLFIKMAGSAFGMFTCEYVKVLPVYLEDGTYKVVADNGYGKVIEMEFIKSYHMEELGIIF